MLRAVRNQLILVVLLSVPALAQRPMVRAVELERRGQYADAVQLYREALAEDSMNIAALVGLERVLTRTGQLETMLPYVRAIVTGARVPIAVRSLELRLWISLNEMDSAAFAARRWVQAAPGDATPYREWSRSLLGRGDVEGARRVLVEGRTALGGPPALAESLAPLAVTVGDWETAALEWRAAVTTRPSLIGGAESSLGLTPPRERERVIRPLTRDGDTVGARLAGGLLANWGDPERGWAFLSTHLPQGPSEQAAWLSRFVEQVKRDRTRVGRRIYGLALERLALAVPPSEANRYRAEAARAFSEAGEVRAARRMLEQLAGEGAAGTATASAQSTLIRLLIGEGKVDDADDRFRTWRDQLAADERTALAEALTTAWIERGELDRAEAVARADSTLAGWALRGWVALYRGALTEAMTFFQSAGPRAGLAPTQRVQMLALAQPIQADSLPALGAALLEVASGDTADGVRALKNVARRLPAKGGRGGLLVYAADLETMINRRSDAETTYRSVMRLDDAAARPAAELGLARLLLRRGENTEAVSLLEHLILTYPESALVPQARRELDRVRGAVPGTR